VRKPWEQEPDRGSRVGGNVFGAAILTPLSGLVRPVAFPTACAVATFFRRYAALKGDSGRELVRPPEAKAQRISSLRLCASA